MNDPKKPPFERVEHYTHGPLVGARWWQERIAMGSDPIARRTALIALGGIGVGVVALGATVAAVAGSSGSSDSATAQDALEVQKTYGWNFGGEADALTTESGAPVPIDPQVLDTLTARLSPKDPRWKPYYVGTLFQSIAATPSTPATASTDAPAKPLREMLRAVVTPGMNDALAKGRALASLCEGQSGQAVVVDLPGAAAVAFAVGLAKRLDPVFGFDNWPHPKGVVPAHLTLAAAAHYAPVLEGLAGSRGVPSLPAFVLDRNRLAPYTDDSSSFDNRYVARLPTVEQLKALGVTKVLYVTPSSSDTESDDLNEDLVAYREAGLVVQGVALDEFAVDLSAPPEGLDGGAPRSSSGVTGSYDAATEVYPNPAYYGGSPSTHYWFWTRYGWPRPRTVALAAAPAIAIAGVPAIAIAARPLYAPTRRTTLFSGTGPAKAKPTGFGSTYVVGTRGGSRPSWSSGSSRSGSWGRSSGFSTGS